MINRLCLSTILMLGLASMALAQRGGPGGVPGDLDSGGFGGGGFGGAPGGPGVPGTPGAGFVENKLDRFAGVLKLSKDQKNSTKEIFDAAQKEAGQLRVDIQKSRSDIAVAILNKKSQQEVDQLLANYGTLMAQMAGIELRAFTKVMEGLNADQQKRAGPAFTMMAGMFSNRNWNTGN